MSVEVSSFGEHAGKAVYLFRVRNDQGMTAAISNYACALTELCVPDREGVLGDVVLGYDTLEGYLGDPAHLGAVVGRYGNRIAKGRFEIDGQVYTLATNNGPNHLHGGEVGFDRRVWDAEPTDSGVRLTYVSPDEEEGYPGRLEVSVVIELTDEGEIVFDYQAKTDAPTHVNLTHHGYFNLGHRSDILDHELTLRADGYTPVDGGLIPTGELQAVAGTPFDFRGGYRIGDRIEGADPQIEVAGGYDHNFVFSDHTGELTEVGSVVAADSGRRMDVLTTEPGVQFYTGNFLDGSIVGKGNTRYGRRSGLCLETQHFPDSPNQPGFPSTLLRPDELYKTQTRYRFGLI